MNIIAISQNISKLEFALFDRTCTRPAVSGELKDWMKDGDMEGIPAKIAAECTKALKRMNKIFAADLVCIRVPYGGQEFKAPEILSRKSLEKLGKIENAAPMHIPALLELIASLKKYFRGIPISLVFETSFFTRLPDRESIYAIDPGLAKEFPLRRFGYHGVFHEQAAQYCRSKDSGKTGILSICLEPIPEVCAIMNGNPLMVTGGATPLEGLPGETTCGDIDPLIILSLSENLGWGPEEINNALSRKGGIAGLVGRKMDFRELFSSSEPAAEFAKRIFLYRILLAAGSAIAALGGVDFVVYSGRYRDLGGQMHSYLSSKLEIFPAKPCILDDNLLALTASTGLMSLLNSIIHEP